MDGGGPPAFPAGLLKPMPPAIAPVHQKVCGEAAEHAVRHAGPDAAWCFAAAGVVALVAPGGVPAVWRGRRRSGRSG